MKPFRQVLAFAQTLSFSSERQKQWFWSLLAVALLSSLPAAIAQTPSNSPSPATQNPTSSPAATPTQNPTSSPATPPQTPTNNPSPTQSQPKQDADDDWWFKAIDLVIKGFGGLAVLVGVVFAWKRLEATERQIHIAQEGQVTDRFTKAIEQLGSDRLEIRLGGIYALERIARDSARDHWPVMEVLTAYVRKHASIKEKSTLVQYWPQTVSQPESKKPTLETDIQAVLTVIGRRNHREQESQPLDLRETDLRGADFRGAYLDRILFLNCNLENTKFENAYLQETSFFCSYLEEAQLGKAKLKKASFEGCRMIGSQLRRCMFRGSKLLICSFRICNSQKCLYEGS